MNKNNLNSDASIETQPMLRFSQVLLFSSVLITMAGCGGEDSTVVTPHPNEENISASMEGIKEADRLRYFKEIKADQALKNFSLSGDGVKITIMGEIVDATHPEISGRVQKQYNTYSQKGAVLSGEGNQPYKFSAFGKGDGHGTHIAGTIAAECDDVGIQGVACGANLDVYDIGAYGNEEIPQQGWGEAGGFERLFVAFSTALDDVTERHSSRILTGSFNVESPAILFEAGGVLDNKSITQIEQRFEQDVRSAVDLSDKGLVAYQDSSDSAYLERVFEDNGSDELTILGTLLPKSTQWKNLAKAVKSYQDSDGVFIITESNHLFENRTSVLNAMPSLSDKVDPGLWISAVLVMPKGLSEMLNNPQSTEEDVEALIARGEYITPINSCGEMAKDYCILIPSYDVFSTMTRSVAEDDSPLYVLNERTYQLQTGHSMGAPMIAAALALMEEHNVKENKGYSMKDLVRILKDNANRSFLGYDSSVHGKGLLDIDAALKAM